MSKSKVNAELVGYIVGTIVAIMIFGTMFIVTRVKGNKAIIDTQYKFDIAYIELANGETIMVEVDTWADSEGEQLTIVSKDGTVYLTNSVRCDLVMLPK